jgi:phosphatidylglycerophosphatase A
MIMQILFMSYLSCQELFFRKLKFIVVILNHILTLWAVQYWRSDDPKHFVLDEVAGYLVIPIFFHHGRPWQVLL